MNVLQNKPAFVYFTNLSPSFAPGGVGEIEIVLKTPPKTMALYLVEVSCTSIKLHSRVQPYQGTTRETQII